MLLVHGLGGGWRSWGPILEELSRERQVIAVDLPGFGVTPPLPGQVTMATLADAVTSFVHTNKLTGIDAVGSSMGARLVLELARRGGVVGGVVALDPGGFWLGWQRQAFYISIYLSIRLVRLLRPLLPFLMRHALTRALLLFQFSAHPAKLSPELPLEELKNYIASPSFDELLRNLAFGESQQGAARGEIQHPLLIGWGRHDRICFPSQSARARELFPDAALQWFAESGHFPHWDQPHASARLILDGLRGDNMGTDAQGSAGVATQTGAIAR